MHKYPWARDVLLFVLEYTALSHTPTDYLEAHVKKQAMGLY